MTDVIVSGSGQCWLGREVVWFSYGISCVERKEKYVTGWLVCGLLPRRAKLRISRTISLLFSWKVQ